MKKLNIVFLSVEALYENQDKSMKIQKFSGKALTFSPKNHLKSEPKYYRHFFLTLALLARNCVKNFQIRRFVWSLFSLTRTINLLIQSESSKKRLGTVHTVTYIGFMYWIFFIASLSQFLNIFNISIIQSQYTNLVPEIKLVITREQYFA